MATVTSSGGFKPSTTDTPLDVRTRVNTYAKIRDIQNPYIGMEITVLSDETNNNEKTKYEVVSLLANEQGIENSIIDLSTLRRKIELYSEDEDIIFNGGSDTINLIQFQPKTDETLLTTEKGIVGAINEIKNTIDNINSGDTPLTTITSEEATISGSMSYIVRNGVCYVTIWGAIGTAVGLDNIVCSTMPTCAISTGTNLVEATNSGATSGFAQVTNNILKISVFKADVNLHGSFSYPIATI